MSSDEWRTSMRPGSPYSTSTFTFFGSEASGAAVSTLDRPRPEALSWPDVDADWERYSPEPSVTPGDVHTALGPHAEEMLRDLDVNVDELIRLINAETTILPVIPDYVPEELTGDRTSSFIPATDLAPPSRSTGKPKHSAIAVATKTWKRRFLRGAVIAVLSTLAGGGAVAMAMNKSVTVTVDGEQVTVNTFSSTVGDVLSDAGISVGKHDALSPAPSAAVGDGGVITLERGRELTVVVDGTERQTWVRATTVSAAFSQLGLDEALAGDAWLSQPKHSAIPLDGMTIEVKTLKTVTLFDGGETPREVSTHAVTVQEFLDAEGLELGAQDEVAKGLERSLVDGSEVRISRTGVTVVNIKEPIAAPVEKINDPELDAGKEEVVEQGKDGEALVTYRVTKRNGVEVGREELSSKVLAEPEPRVIKVGTKQPAVSDAGVWDRLAHCESTGNWSINTGNGYYGGLQFNKQTWDAYGGQQYAEYPHQASREQQIAIATKLRDARGGYSAWPACSRKLGLPT